MKKILDDFIESSAKVADQSVKIAGEALEQAKAFAGEAYEQARTFAVDAYGKASRKMTRISLENDLAKAQRQLGTLYYLMRKTGEENEELLTQHYEEVAAIEEKLEALLAEDAVEETPEEAETREEAEATEETAAAKEPRQPEAFEKEAEEETLCPVCGAKVKVTDVYCPTCGAKLSE